MKTITTIGLIAILVGGALYWAKFGEGPNHQRVIDLAKDPFSWSISEIRSSPSLWYKSAIRKLDVIADDIEDAEMGVGIKERTWQHAAANAKAKIQGHQKYMGKAKNAYLEAEAAQAWPMTYSGREFSKEEFQANTLKVHHALGREQERLKTYSEMRRKAKAMVTKFRTQLDLLRETKLDLELGLELASAGDVLLNLKDQSNACVKIQVTHDVLHKNLERLLDDDPSFTTPQGDSAAFDEIMKMNEGREPTEADILIN